MNDEFDWEGDAPQRRRWRDSVIYELHVKGMTQLHDRVPEELRGTYAGLATPAVTDYLRDLGVTAVELLPIHQFFSEPALAERGLVNYWGYNSLGFFAPHNAYSASAKSPGGDRGEQVREFKQMVKAFHDAGLEVILDVVYNHTAEAGPLGPTLSFRGLDDLGYYQRVDAEQVVEALAEPPADTYWDVTGCGNTVDATHTQSLRMILDSLRYWVNEMHVDGFPLRPAERADPHGPAGRHGQPPADGDRPGPAAAPREADRRAVGRLDGRLPRRRVPAAVGRVERPVPRHHARLLARPHLRRADRRHRDRRVERPVRR
ncbi:alpha-amylase family glycosyl hydrolase [Nocardioides sp. B-3]|uniref:alpha-amylase family glycosyl hydrolase n=1 Tax=Nocardioides sp. B-3 TaxID=2895565 RepID=UPI0021526CCA|nr:alpha-amylase family glycosyl hydrolase [Nocardioides sp. B-3]UUZ58429.1 hypothetical protein LP418_19890 [Nocardioides sp. B-3]